MNKAIITVTYEYPGEMPENLLDIKNEINSGQFQREMAESLEKRGIKAKATFVEIKG